MKALLLRHKHFIYYVIIGSIAFSLDASVFFMLSDVLGVHFIIANCFAVFFGILISFLLNAKYNFKKHDRKMARLLSFFVVCLVGMILGTVLLTLFYQYLGMWKFPSKLFSVMIAGVFQYIFNKKVTFGDQSKGDMV
ncbi:MAG: GtrA family protein [Clostridia bacterium]